MIIYNTDIINVYLKSLEKDVNLIPNVSAETSVRYDFEKAYIHVYFTSEKYLPSSEILMNILKC